MESNSQKSYSVLTKEEVRSKMEKEIDEVCNIFSVTKSAATVTLMRHGWSLFRVSDSLGDNKEKFLTESGLNVVALTQEERVSSCGICLETHPMDHTTSTTFCPHSFCRSCWGEYLKHCLDQNPKVISCPIPDCQAAVGPDTIQQLSGKAKKMYWNYALRSYLQGKKEVIKWCPAPDCEYAIEILNPSDDEDECFSVVCVCAHIFCWRCQLESHRPLTCNSASDWLLSMDGDTNELSLAWIAANTKPCPSCLRPIELDSDQGCKILTCAAPCRFHFCWNCLGSLDAHVYAECSEAFLPAGTPPDVFERRQLMISSNLKYSTCLECWKAAHDAMQKAISDLHDIESSKIYDLCQKFDRSVQEMGFVREAWMLIVQCRQVLKWSYVYGYFLADYLSAKRQYLQHLQEEANNTVKRYSENLEKETKEALLNESIALFSSFKHRLNNATSTTGNFFHNFVKTLEDGLPEVKVASFDDFGELHWFCDVCTYQNTWLDKQCRMCTDDGFALSVGK